jgi:tRNA A-37 threonylcarbamoyl transferase component Bud32
MSEPKASHAGRLPRGRRFGRYEVLDLLGAGGIGEVYRARDRSLSREVALKVLTAEATRDSVRFRRFQTEAQASAALSHPNIVSIYDVGEEGGTPYIVSELVEGTTLAGALARGPFPTRRLLELAAGIAEGLAAAHGQGIVHRDLKPANVLLTAGGVPKIADFGLAKYFRPSSDSEGSHLSTLPDERTAEGTILGTVGYMSPEQAKGEAADFRSDQFSFGSILYEMATGKQAFQKNTGAETLAAIIREEPEPIATLAPQAPASLRWIVERCLAKESRQRYGSTDDLARDLATLRDRLSEATTSGGRGVAARALLLLGVGLGTAILGLLAGVTVFRRIPPAPPSFRQLTFRRGGIAEARFAPDGYTIIYSASWEGRPIELFTTRLDGSGSRSLGLVRASILSVSPTGEIAVKLRLQWPLGTLARVPLGGGAPREVLDNVGAADWAPDGSGLLVVHRVGAMRRIEYPIGKTLYEASHPISPPRFSRDGRRVAFIEGDGQNDSLSILELGRGKRTLLSVNFNPLGWSPNGNEIWFSTGREIRAATLSGRVRTLLRVPVEIILQDVSRDGRVLVECASTRHEVLGVFPGETRARNVSWLDGSVGAGMSADGKSLLINEINEGAFYFRKIDDAEAVRLGEGTAVALTRDGKLALSWKAALPRQLVLLPTGVGETRMLDLGSVNFRGVAGFSSDGSGIVLEGQEAGHGLRSYLLRLDGGRPHPITPEGVAGTLLSPDGQWLVTHAVSDGSYGISDVAGGRRRPLLLGDREKPIQYREKPIQWSEDGRALFVCSSLELPAKVYRLDLATGRKDLWRELMPEDAVGVAGMGDVFVTPAGTSFAASFIRFFSDLFVVEGLQ